MTARPEKAILAATLFLSHFAAAAQIGVSAQFGTTGVGAQLHTPLAPHFSGRLGANVFSYDYSSTTANTNYDAEVRLRTIDALVDWHPMAGSFRVTSGLIFNNNKVNLNGRPSGSGSFTFNGVTYRVSDIGNVEGDIRFRRVAPYLGIGWGTAGTGEKPGWSFTSDVGIMFQGKPRANLRSSGCDFGQGPAGNSICSQLSNDLRDENARLEDEIDQYRYYPVLRLGANYRF